MRVDRVEVHQQTGDGAYGGLCPGGVVYNIEVESNHNYFVDGVLVHNCYKNLYAARARFGSQPKFLGGQGQSNRAFDTGFKAKWLREKNAGKGVYMLTATPTKNSPLEIYSMLSYVAPEEFERLGIRNSEDFLDRAGVLEVVSDDLYQRDPHAILETFHLYQTTVGIKGGAIGRQAAHFIVERAEGRVVAERVIDIGFTIIEREST